jgi:hypothetical protein
LVSVVAGCCMNILRHTNRPLYETIWNKKWLSGFRILFIRQIFPFVSFSYFRGSKTLCWKKISNAKKSRSAVF